jgi:hypothetical protein
MMKNGVRSLLVVAALAGAGNAMGATIWEPTDVSGTGNVNIIQAGPVSIGGGTLALFEDTDALLAVNALVLGAIGGVFEFTDNNDGSFAVASYVNDVFQDKILMDGDEFILAVDWGLGYVADSSATQNAQDPSSWLLEFDDGKNGGVSLAVDLQPVPLPAAAWLFGSALLGMVGLARRRQS